MGYGVVTAAERHSWDQLEKYPAIRGNQYVCHLWIDCLYGYDRIDYLYWGEDVSIRKWAGVCVELKLMGPETLSTSFAVKMFGRLKRFIFLGMYALDNACVGRRRLG